MTVETPVPSERGRYAIYEEPDGGLAIPRSAPLCERCASCGCGDQQEPLRIPAMIVKLWQARQNGDGPGMAAQIKAARGLLRL